MTTWSVTEWLAVIGAFMAALSAFAGGVWWMSALYANVRDIRDYMAEFRNQDKEEKKLIWDHLKETRRVVANHGQRLVVLENHK